MTSDRERVLIQQYDNAHRAYLEALEVVREAVFGNHEALSSMSPTQTGPYFDMFSFPTAGEVGGIASGTEAYYSFDYANVHFIVLDSEQSPTSSSTPMLTWLEADLQATTAGWIIALWHRPEIGGLTPPRSPMARPALCGRRSGSAAARPREPRRTAS